MVGLKALSISMVFSFLFLFGCLELGGREKSDNDSLVAVVSIPPQQEFVGAIAKDNVDVILLVPPGANPHSYEPTASQLAKISQADIYFTVGSGLEVETIWISKIKSLNKNIKIIDTHKGISLIDMVSSSNNQDGEDGVEEHFPTEETDTQPNAGKDPHIWLSIRNAEIMVQNIRDALIAADSKNSHVYEKNANKYLKNLNSLDVQLTESLSEHRGKVFFVFHPAWGYFAEDYGLRQEAIENLGKEPTPEQLAQIVRTAKKDNIKIVFASPQFSTDSANTVANQIGGRVVLLNPLEKNYLENTKKMAENLFLVFGDE